MILKKILYIPFFLFVSIQLLAQNYLWPTNASTYLTSSFCEYRPGHYHSAIDIKTWNKEGYPIYAIEDGFIYRIRVSPFGYGKVIYLKLKDGNYAVYAHLQKFTKSLESKIRTKQMTNQRYTLNWYPKNLNVKKGDILGYTGSTGIGTPHLHFEIRNAKEHPLNPLAFYSQVKDRIRPRLQKIAVLPRDHNSYVNKSYFPQVFDLTYIKDGIYVIKQPIKAFGKIGLALKGYDQADGVYNKFAFYRTTLEIEGVKVFQITYDKMDFATTGYIDTEIYYPFWSNNREVFHKLYVEPFNILTFYTDFKNTNDIIKLDKTPVSFTIIVEDFHGNTSKIAGEIQPDANDKIFVSNKFVQNNSVYLKFSLESFNYLSFSHSDNLSDWQEVNYFEILDRESSNPGHTLFTKIKLPDSTAKFLRIETKSFHNEPIYKTIQIAHIDSVVDPSIDFSDKNLILTTSYLGDNFKIFSNGFENNYSPLQNINGNSQVAIPVNKFHFTDIKFGFDNNDTTRWISPVDMKLFYPDSGTTSYFADSSVMIKSRFHSFFDTTLIQVKKFEVDSIGLKIPYLKNVYEIMPDDIALLKSVSMVIQADSIYNSPSWGVYKFNGGDKVSFVSSNYDSLKNGFSFRTSSFGKYVIAQDTIAPVLQITAPLENNTYSKNPRIRFTTFDEHAGISSEENISITVDSLFLLPEWDPEEDIVFAKIDQKLDPGKHELIVSIEDAAGNTTKTRLLFYIN